jgi:hypothetical protein
MTYSGDPRARATAAGSAKRLPAVAALVLVGFVLLVAPAARAQDDPPLPVDPTPLADLMNAQEKALVAGARNPKQTVEAYLKVADGRVEAALAAVKSNDTPRAERELDVFQKAMGECVKVTDSLTDGKRHAAKKVEQALYKELRTLESVERLFPAERVQFAEAAIKRAKRFRVQMLNIAIASGEVLKDPDADKPPKTEVHDEASPVRPPVFQSRGPAALVRPVAWRRQFPGDYLTEEEDEHVREAQAADDRIKVFMRIADRRLTALNPTPAPTEAKAQKKAEEEDRLWGQLPKLNSAELMRHYSRAIEEVMAKLEDAYERNPKSGSIPKALALLRDATDRHLGILRSLEPGLKDDKEVAAFREALDQAEVANKGARDGLKK